MIRTANEKVEENIEETWASFETKVHREKNQA